MRVCIIIPAYNEQDSILKVIDDIKKNLFECDYIVINDCSKDGTEELLVKNNINHILLPVNLGLAGAVQTGYKYAYENEYDCAIQFDGDGQHQARYVMKLADEIKNGADIAIGSRFVEQKKPLTLRMLGSRLITFLIKMKTGVKVTDPTSGMRMLNRTMINDYAYNMNRKPEPDTLAYQIKKGYKVKEIQVEMNDREAGESIYNGLTSSIKYMIKTTIAIIFTI